MSAFGMVVIGKRETLLRPNGIRPGEAPIDWPDQGTAERNWALNSVLLDRVIAAGGPIRDADIVSGILTAHSGFLARERRQMRAAGLRLGTGAFWQRPTYRSLTDLAPTLIARARAAAASGARTFAVPEAAPVAVWIAAHATDADVRARSVAWLRNGTGYHDFVRMCVRAAFALDPATVSPVFRAKVVDEIEPVLSLWPHVLVMPTTARLSRVDLIRLRAFPLHPLGLVERPTWADGCLLPPSEYLLHDLDHARFKVREDLRLRGISIPDAYRDGSTIDPHTGRHRSILPFARGYVDALAPKDGFTALANIQRTRDQLCALPGPAARAAELLLFEIVHEKSLPLDRRALAGACRDDSHLLKLERKCARGFFGADSPAPEVIAALPSARSALVELCA